MQRPSPRGAGEPPGQGQQGAPQRFGDGLLLAGGRAEAGGPAQQVMGQGGGQQPRGVGGKPARGQMRQPGACLEVADRQLADGVTAVVGIQPGGGADAVGDEGVIPQVGNSWAWSPALRTRRTISRSPR
jgi:hypothetical protein